jgi:hypothetical protein
MSTECLAGPSFDSCVRVSDTERRLLGSGTDNGVSGSGTDGGLLGSGTDNGVSGSGTVSVSKHPSFQCIAADYFQVLGM